MQGYYNSICFLPCFTLFFIIYKCLLLFSHSVVSHSLRPHGLQHARLTCPSQPHCVCLNSCLLNQWCHPTISSSATPFSFCPQSFPASASFPMCWLLASGGQSTGASAAVLPMNAAAAAAAKLLQSCPTLCDPTDSNPTGSPVPGILQARIVEWVAISFSNEYWRLISFGLTGLISLLSQRLSRVFFSTTI